MASKYAFPRPKPMLLEELRELNSYDRRRMACDVCGHALLYHKIRSGNGECFTSDLTAHPATRCGCLRAVVL